MVLSIFYTIILIFTITFYGRAHLREEETKAQRDQVTWLAKVTETVNAKSQDLNLGSLTDSKLLFTLLHCK